MGSEEVTDIRDEVRDELTAALDLHWMDYNAEMQTATCSCGDWQFDADRDIVVGEHFAPFSRHVADALLADRGLTVVREEPLPVPPYHDDRGDLQEAWQRGYRAARLTRQPEGQ